MTAISDCPLEGRSANRHGRRVVIGIPCLLVGGTEVHTLSLGKALRSGGYDVSVCCYHEHDAGMVSTFRDSGIPVDLLNVPRAKSRIRSLLAQPLARSFSQLLSRRRPDVVHIQYMTPGVTPVVVAKAVAVPRIVATVHVTASHYGSRRWIPKVVASRLCDAFICVSKTAEASFFKEPPALFEESAWGEGRRHFTIHNCVELPAEQSEIGEEPSGRLCVGIVGRLDSYKGHDVLLDAMSRVIRRFENASLLCVGDGDRREALQAQAKRLGIAEHVIWAGRVPPDQVPSYLRQMDVVAMPSRPGLEGFGLAAAEAMAHGKPVVASDVDALAEVVGSGLEAGGLLVPPMDSAALASALEALLSDERKRATLGAAGRQRVENLFSSKAFAERHLRLYDMLCGVDR